jgi:UPF0755 protein
MLRRPGFVGIFLALAALCLFMLVIFGYGSLTTALRADEPAVVEVRRGDSLTRVIQRLLGQNLLRNPGMFRLLAIIRGDTGRIKAGEYFLEGAVSPNGLLDFLVQGSTRDIALTIPEGFSLRDIADRLDRMNLGHGAEFLRLCRDKAFIASLNLPINPKAPSLEGYIFPETYYLQPGLGEARLIGMMVGVFRNRVGALLSQNSRSNGLTPYESLILASIIEKETGAASERKLISGVFHNRLKARMRLDSDPTVIYGVKSFNGNLTRVHLRQRTPWNTYKIFGLPVTPIANPGLHSIRAALSPARVNYLYFVSKGDGTHVFSTNLKAHNRAVYKYQKRPHRRSRSKRSKS